MLGLLYFKTRSNLILYFNISKICTKLSKNEKKTNYNKRLKNSTKKIKIRLSKTNL